MYSDLELQVIEELNIPYFGEALQELLSIKDELHVSADNKLLPPKNMVKDFYRGIEAFSREFDITYLLELNKYQVNPLQLEQRAWTLLSPAIKQHQQKFAAFAKKYSEKKAVQETIPMLIEYLDGAAQYLGMWNAISASFNEKHIVAHYHRKDSPEQKQELWSARVVPAENNVQALIAYLGSAKQTP